jgi:tRNA-2-methylthio-N6-dimethylallyladenosine synthase
MDGTAPTAPAKRVWIEAFGCQMNILDGEFALGDLRRMGYGPAAGPDEADLVVFNTCSVRQHSEDRVWSRLGALEKRKRIDPSLIVAVMGCMAEREGEELLRRAPVVDVVVGTRRYGDLARMVGEVEASGRRLVTTGDPRSGFREPSRDVAVRGERHRGWVSVMRGCCHRCSFCVVPSVRGPQFDRDEASIIDEVRRLADDGASEIFLLGQNINTWGRTLPDRPTLDGLLRRVHEVPGVRRIRFLTSNPMDLETPLLDAMGELPRVMPYLHFPAQHGSDGMLRRMHRGYTRARYLELAAEARARVPGIELASDLIVGFPGETEEEFRELRSLQDEVRWSMAFVFKYSPRPGTKAAEVPDDVPEAVKSRRHAEVLEAQDRVQAVLHADRLGSEVEVLVDGPSARNPERVAGRTEHHQLAVLPREAGGPGEYVRGRVHRVSSRVLHVDPLPRGAAAGTRAPEGAVR